MGWKHLALLCATVVLCGCNGTYQRLQPGGQVIRQNITYAPQTSASAPAQVSRSGGLQATITAALPTQSISIANQDGACVTTELPSGGLQTQGTSYLLTFVASAGAAAGCTQTVTVTVDGDTISFYLTVP